MGRGVLRLFASAARTLSERRSVALTPIARDGMIWVSWTQKIPKRQTDTIDDPIHLLGLLMSLAEVQVCAVDATSPGLELAIRKEGR